MIVKYTPGTPEGLVGKTYKVEIVKMVTISNRHVLYPMVKEVQIKYEDGKKEWISGDKFYNKVDMEQKVVEKMTF